MKINDDIRANFQEYIEQVKKEADILKSLDHPNIVKFYACYDIGERFCLVTEYCAVRVS